MQEEKYLVYMHINKINKKVYVGQTSNSSKERWRNGYGYRGQYFFEAIEEFGWDNFEHIIIAENLTMSEAQVLEAELITKYCAKEEAFGYNKTSGGFGSKGRNWTLEEREKMSLTQKECWQDPERRVQAQKTQKEIWNTPEGKEKRSKQAIELWKSDAYRATHTGANHARSKPVRCKETGQIFDNARQAATWALKANPQNIGKCCKGERQHCGNHPETNEKLSWEFI